MSWDYGLCYTCLVLSVGLCTSVPCTVPASCGFQAQHPVRHAPEMSTELTFKGSVGAWPPWSRGCTFDYYFCLFCDHGLVSLAFFTSFWANLDSFYFLKKFLFPLSFQINWNKLVNSVSSTTMFALKTWIQHSWFVGSGVSLLTSHSPLSTTLWPAAAPLTSKH